MDLTTEQLVTMYTNLVRARKLDELLVEGLKSGKCTGFFHSGQGEEAVGVGGASFLRDDDFLYPHHRGHCIAFFLARGLSPKGWVAMHYGKMLTEKPEGPTMEERGIYGVAGTIGGMFPLAVGWGIAAKKNNKNQVVVCFFGDGSAGRGTLHEGMNLAAIWKLPIVWACDNNLYGMFQPLKDAYARKDIADLATPYDMPAVVVDGQDVLAVHEAIQAAVERARAGKGPSMVEVKTYRYRAHAEGMPDVSHAEPRPKEEIEAWKKRDPVILFREKLLERNVITAVDVERIEKETDAEMAALDKMAMESPHPDPKDPGILDTWLYSE
jgi:acetoin:2,6-dichlorophenolindophenol oxidoreductase subunit alpha